MEVTAIKRREKSMVRFRTLYLLNLHFFLAVS